MNQVFNLGLNPLWFVWSFITTVVSAVCIWLLVHPKSAPKFVVEAMLYGKISNRQGYRILQLIQVPKSWFTHFYAFGTTSNILYLILVCRLYFFQTPVPGALINLFDILIPNRHVSVDALAALLGVALMTVQTARRFYECVYVSVYSPATINVVHYFIGLLFYFSVTVTLLSEAPGFSRFDSIEVARNPPPLVLRWNHIVGLLLFVYGSFIHQQSHVILANIRKDKTGKVVSARHAVPKGGMFSYISCPHYFGEIIIYLGLLTVLNFRHFGWWLIMAWVICSQILSAGLTHQWYKDKYKDYPKERKAVIPFLW